MIDRRRFLNAVGVVGAGASLEASAWGQTQAADVPRKKIAIVTTL